MGESGAYRTGEAKGGRDCRLDYLRVFAVLGVILVHTLDQGIRELDPGSWQWMAVNCFIVLGFSCNILYVMISGALLLPFREEGVLQFYGRRMGRVLIPLAAYYGWYLWVNGHSFGNLEGWRSAFAMFLSGAPGQAPHFWLVYVLLSLYVAVPFLRYMVKDMPRRTSSALCAVILLFSCASTYLPIWGIQPGISVWLSSWSGVMVLGYWLYRPSARAWDRRLMAAGAAAYLASLALVRLRSDYSALVLGCTPTMIMTGGGLFSLFMGARVFSRDGWVLRLFSKYSYSIILIHWFVLYWVVGRLLHATVLTGNMLVGAVLTTGLTCLFSLAAAIAYDHTVVWALRMCVRGVQRPCAWACGRVAERMRKG